MGWAFNLIPVEKPLCPQRPDGGHSCDNKQNSERKNFFGSIFVQTHNVAHDPYPYDKLKCKGDPEAHERSKNDLV